MSFEQLSFFEEQGNGLNETVYASPDYDNQTKWREWWNKRLSVGDKIAGVVLGDCEIATISEVEGNERYFFYRTDKGCFNPEEARTDIDACMREAEEEREKYIYIQPCNLSERLTVRYKPRKCDGRVLWAQIGYFGDLLFWKESATYQFCESIPDIGKREKRYKEIVNTIYEDGEPDRFDIVEDEIPMKRLYLRKNGLYAEAGYSVVAVRREEQQ